MENPRQSNLRIITVFISSFKFIYKSLVTYTISDLHIQQTTRESLNAINMYMVMAVTSFDTKRVSNIKMLLNTKYAFLRCMRYCKTDDI